MIFFSAPSVHLIFLATFLLKCHRQQHRYITETSLLQPRVGMADLSGMHFFLVFLVVKDTCPATSSGLWTCSAASPFSSCYAISLMDFWQRPFRILWLVSISRRQSCRLTWVLTRKMFASFSCHCLNYWHYSQSALEKSCLLFQMQTFLAVSLGFSADFFSWSSAFLLLRLLRLSHRLFLNLAHGVCSAEKWHYVCLVKRDGHPWYRLSLVLSTLLSTIFKWVIIAASKWI